ncbi:MAG: D-glycerate dehydrogenase [Rhizobiaceae bacterium]
MSSESPRIFITQPMAEQGLAVLEGKAEVHVNDLGRPMTESEVVAVAERLNPDAYIGTFAELHRTFSRRVIDASPKLKVIGWNGLSSEHIDLDRATERGVYVTFVDLHCAAVSDHAMALILCAAKKLIPAYQAVKAGRWEAEGAFFNLQFMGSDVHHKTLGIVGLGRIGAGVAKRAAGFDMKILYHDAMARPELEQSLGIRRASLDELMSEADYVCCSLPLTPSTEKLFGRAEFSRMKPNAYFINVSRGGCVDTDALCEVLRENKIAGAAIDVTSPEPVPSDHELLGFENVAIFPHIAGMTIDTRIQSQIEVARDVLDVLRGVRPARIMNPAVMDVRPLRAG